MLWQWWVSLWILDSQCSQPVHESSSVHIELLHLLQKHFYMFGFLYKQASANEPSYPAGPYKYSLPRAKCAHEYTLSHSAWLTETGSHRLWLGQDLVWGLEGRG